jgi:hypothetical protein
MKEEMICSDTLPKEPSSFDYYVQDKTTLLFFFNGGNMSGSPLK